MAISSVICFLTCRAKPVSDTNSYSSTITQRIGPGNLLIDTPWAVYFSLSLATPRCNSLFRWTRARLRVVSRSERGLPVHLLYKKLSKCLSLSYPLTLRWAEAADSSSCTAPCLLFYRVKRVTVLFKSRMICKLLLQSLIDEKWSFGISWDVGAGPGGGISEENGNPHRFPLDVLLSKILLLCAIQFLRDKRHLCSNTLFRVY